MKPIACALCLALATGPAWGVQHIRLDGQGTPAARVAASEPSILAIEGGRIRKVWTAADKASIRPDEEGGQVVIQPMGRGKTQPFTVFVKDDQGQVHTVVLTPAQIPGETVILIPPRQRTARARRRAMDWEASQPYERTLTELIRHMVLGQAPEGYEVVATHRAVPLWEETETRLVARYLGGFLSGEVYRLTNASGREMRLAEDEFYRAGVRAVAITRPVLAPGEATEVYLVLGGADDE